MSEYKILMVCLGNICRSPVAEGVMQHIAKERGLKLHIDSAGTSGHHNGEAPDRRSQQNAKTHGIDISKQRSRKFTREDFLAFDKIYVMDGSNYRDVTGMARNDEERNKVDLLLNILYPGRNMGVPDPWYGGERGFEEVFQLIKLACGKLADQLEQYK